LSGLSLTGLVGGAFLVLSDATFAFDLFPAFAALSALSEGSTSVIPD